MPLAYQKPQGVQRVYVPRIGTDDTRGRGLQAPRTQTTAVCETQVNVPREWYGNHTQGGVQVLPTER